MDFTVIICTYNRSENLPKCISALESQENVDNLNWEILIVDNNSTDNTKSIVDELSQKSKLLIRYAFEPEQGLNHARNCGIRESKGTYFAYIDDDITVSKKWLFSLYQVLSENNADAGGSRIFLDPSIILPPWIAKNPEMYGFLGFQDYGDKALQLDGFKLYPYGGNMAFNRRVPEEIGFFNTSLGRKGEGKKKNELFKGAETDYFHRLSASKNAKIFYTPDAIVFHHILPHQLKKKYFLTIHYNAGYQKAFYDESYYSRTFFGIPLFLFSQILRSILKYFSIVVSQGFDIGFRQQMTIAHYCGTISGYFHRNNNYQ